MPPALFAVTPAQVKLTPYVPDTPTPPLNSGGVALNVPVLVAWYQFLTPAAVVRV